MVLKQAQLILRKHLYSIVAFLAIFLFFFHPNIGLYDWNKEIIYVQYIKESVFKSHILPVFLWNSSQLAGYPAVDQSALFIGNPETLLFSPLIPLLGILEPIQFLKTVFLFNFLIGFVGLIVLGRKLNWSTRQHRLFTGLFLLSPIIIQHIALGYVPWVNLFLFPWLIFFLLSNNPFFGGIGSGIVLGLILLQGGSHVFVWFSAFLVLFILIQILCGREVKTLIHFPAALLTTVLLAFPRLFFTYQVFSKFSQRFFSGYTLRGFLQLALIPPMFFTNNIDHIEQFIEDYIDGVPYWDGATYWGFLLIFLLLLPLILYYGKKKSPYIKQNEFKQILYPLVGSSLILLVFSFGGIYQSFISFFAKFLGIPGLEGMEKYPFRFAILSYYGFSLVVAHIWPMILDVISLFLDFIKGLKIKQNKIANKIDQKLFRWRKFITLICIFFITMFVLSVVAKTPLENFMHVKISRAYYGNNNDWMSQMMENTSDIPLESYINKYDTVYGNFQCAAILISGFFVILRFISGNLEKIRKWDLSILTKINVHRSLLLEVLFIIPLVFSSGMWLRVALATPPTSFSELIIAPPLVLSDESEQLADINDITFSPLQFNFWAEGQTAGKRIYFPDISFSDAGFMEMTTDNAFIYNHQGQLGIQILKTGNVNIRINLQYFPFIIMLLSWFLIIPLLIIKRKVL